MYVKGKALMNNRLDFLFSLILAFTASSFVTTASGISLNWEIGWGSLMTVFSSVFAAVSLTLVLYSHVSLRSALAGAHRRDKKTHIQPREKDARAGDVCSAPVHDKPQTARDIYAGCAAGSKETLDSITDAITIVDNNHNIIYANRAAREMLCLGPGHETQKCFRYYHGLDTPPAGCPSCQCKTFKKEVAVEVFEPHLMRHLEIRALPLLDQEDNLKGLIHISRDISERKVIEGQLHRQLNRLRALRMIDLAISSSFSLNSTLEVVLDQVKDQLRVDAASIMLFDPDTQLLRYAVGGGFLTDRIRKVSIRAGESYAGHIVLNREIVLIPDLEKSNWSRAHPGGYDFARSFLTQEELFKAYCGIPLIAKGTVNGVLEVFHRSVFSPDRDWMEFLEALAGQAAIALDSAMLFDRLQQSREEIMAAYDTTIEGWAMALDLRDSVTNGHSKRVCDMTVRIAQEMGVPESEIIHIRRGALLHDIGKLVVPDSILHKKSALNGEEWSRMKQHPQIAYELLSRIPFLEKAVDIPYCHHERWDGKGYPRGLQGKEIPFAARIFAIVDIWDALCSDRPYRAAWGRDDVVKHICALSGSHLDPGLVEVFLQAGPGQS